MNAHAPASSDRRRARTSDPAVSLDVALRPPVWLLGVAASAVTSSAVLLLADGRIVDLAGYALATVATVLAVGAFRALDNRRRSRPTYVVPALAQKLPPTVLSWVLLGLGVAVGGLHVWRFAEAVARQ